MAFRSPATFLLCFSLFYFLRSSSSSSIAITLSKPILDSPWQIHIGRLAVASVVRASHLKNPPSTVFSTETSLTSHNYGGYSISLDFGTPSQKVSLIMDTGSDLVWLPCTSHYMCRNCNASTSSSPFIPRLSSSSRMLGCGNPKCGWVNQLDLQSRCGRCRSVNSTNCDQMCPPYVVLYGSGSTAGMLLSETLQLPGKKVDAFLVGCSLASSQQPAGIAGFGRGNESLPSQLRLGRFSYCVLSRRFDDTAAATSLLVMEATSGSGKTAGMHYTPFLRNPVAAGNRAFSSYYYVSLRRIFVGEHHVRVPEKHSEPERGGAGGTIVDSGTTFTFMESEVFEQVSGKFTEQVNLSRVPDAELHSGLRPCYNISGGTAASLPPLKFQFKGGAVLKLPVENYFASIGDYRAACLTIVSGGSIPSSGGPSIILGSFQFQNFKVSFDLRNERFGFMPKLCR